MRLLLWPHQHTKECNLRRPATTYRGIKFHSCTLVGLRLLFPKSCLLIPHCSKNFYIQYLVDSFLAYFSIVRQIPIAKYSYTESSPPFLPLNCCTSLVPRRCFDWERVAGRKTLHQNNGCRPGLHTYHITMASCVGPRTGDEQTDPETKVQRSLGRWWWCMYTCG